MSTKLQRIGNRHYLIWVEEKPVTEVRCMPAESDRWFFRGGFFDSRRTRASAIEAGICRAAIGKTVTGKPLEDWSNAARVAIESAKT